MGRLLLTITILFCLTNSIVAQATLPNIFVENVGGKIIVSWKNNYKQNIASLNIQRSFDSTRNYTTIGSVLNPQAIENGFADNKPPYIKMYYRVFVSFEGGSYAFSNIVRPLQPKVNYYIPAIDPLTGKVAVDTSAVNIFANQSKEPILFRDSAGIKIIVRKSTFGDAKIQQKNTPQVETPKAITYPSRLIFTNKNNAISIALPEADVKKYIIKFFNDKAELAFELKNLTTPNFILEKVNFEHSGWYNFELYENGMLLEKNKFYVPKDGKNVQIPKPQER
jgi:hypothetical protein